MTRPLLKIERIQLYAATACFAFGIFALFYLHAYLLAVVDIFSAAFCFYSFYKLRIALSKDKPWAVERYTHYQELDREMDKE